MEIPQPSRQKLTKDLIHKHKHDIFTPMKLESNTISFKDLPNPSNQQFRFRKRSKQSKIRSLFKQAKHFNGETFLTPTKSKYNKASSQRYLPSSKKIQIQSDRLQVNQLKLIVTPIVQISVNDEQNCKGDLSKIILDFQEGKKRKQYYTGKQRENMLFEKNDYLRI